MGDEEGTGAGAGGGVIDLAGESLRTSKVSGGGGIDVVIVVVVFVVVFSLVVSFFVPEMVGKYY